MIGMCEWWRIYLLMFFRIVCLIVLRLCDFIIIMVVWIFFVFVRMDVLGCFFSLIILLDICSWEYYEKYWVISV